MTSGMVGADLANLINEAALLAVRRSQKKASMDVSSTEPTEN
jgi:ATP-dependent Zn protease